MQENEIKRIGDFEEDEINLLDYLIVIFKRKKVIIGITFACTLITAIISLIIPEIYRAETIILPPQNGSSGMADQLISQFAGGAAGIAGNLLDKGNISDLYVSMLQSRTILDLIIERFNLKKRYKVETPDDARQGLNNNINIKSDRKSGIITVSVEDKDPKLAAQMANAFIEELKDMTKKLAITEASQRRVFFEEHLRDAKESLIKAEEDMARFQEETGALKIDDQASAIIEAIARLKAQIAEKEVELKVRRTYSTPTNPDLQRIEETMEGLRIELKKLERGQGKVYDPLMPTERMPEVGTEYLRRLRDLKFNETLYELLLKQYEMAKLDEARDAVLIQVIDKAIPHEKRVKPKRRLMVTISTLTGLFFSLFAVFFMEYIERSSNDPENKERLEMIRRYFPLMW